jgi:hypothetical protein
MHSKRNRMHFQRFHFVDSALVALRAAEASFQKRLDQFPRKRGPDHLSTQRKDIHVVVFNSLMGGEYVVNKSGSYAGNLIGAYGCAHSTAAKRYSAIHLASGHGVGKRDHVIGVIVSGTQLMSAEVDDLVARASQQLRDLLFENEPSMV